VFSFLPTRSSNAKATTLHVADDVPYLRRHLGGEVTVNTIDGRVALRIPELTQNGRQIRLGGKGMPVLGAKGKRGDLYVKVRAGLPDTLTPEEREHLEVLRKLRQGAARHQEAR